MHRRPESVHDDDRAPGPLRFEDVPGTPPVPRVRQGAGLRIRDGRFFVAEAGDEAGVEDIAFRMLAAGNFPQHRTLCEFRRRHLDDLGAVFAEAGDGKYARRKWMAEAPVGWIKEVMGLQIQLPGPAEGRGGMDPRVPGSQRQAPAHPSDGMRRRPLPRKCGPRRPASLLGPVSALGGPPGPSAARSQCLRLRVSLRTAAALHCFRHPQCASAAQAASPVRTYRRSRVGKPA